MAAISIMSRDVHSLIFPSSVSSSEASSGTGVVHAHHDKLVDVPIHDLCLADVQWGVLMMLGLVDGTCSVFSFPEKPAASSTTLCRPMVLRRIAVGYCHSSFFLPPTPKSAKPLFPPPYP